MHYVFVCYFQDVCGPCSCFKHYHDAYSYVFSMTDEPLIKLVDTGYHTIFKIKVVGDDAYRFFHIEMFEIQPSNFVFDDE